VVLQRAVGETEATQEWSHERSHVAPFRSGDIASVGKEVNERLERMHRGAGVHRRLVEEGRTDHTHWDFFGWRCMLRLRAARRGKLVSVWVCVGRCVGRWEGPVGRRTHSVVWLAVMRDSCLRDIRERRRSSPGRSLVRRFCVARACGTQYKGLFVTYAPR
jgi:hypothetical protein